MPKGPRGGRRPDLIPGGRDAFRYGGETLEPWDSPQHLPDGPQNLPVPGQRPTMRAPGLVGVSPDPMPGGTPELERPFPVRDAHRYAKMVQIIDAPSSTTSAKVLDAPDGFRNMLMFRNTSASANVFIGFGTAANSSSALKLTAGQLVLFDSVVPQDDIWTFADAVSATLSIAYSNIPVVL